MMNIRVINPAASGANNNVSQYETERLRYIKYHIAMYGTTLLAICQTLRQMSED